jgi:lipoprotein
MRKIIYLVICIFAVQACSEDSITPELDFDVNPELSTSTSLDKKISDFYQKYDTYIVYNYSKEDINWNWDSYRHYVYSFPANAEYAEKLLDFIETKFLSGFADDILKKYLPYRIYLADTLWETSNKKTQRYALEGVNYFVFGGASEKNFPAEKNQRAAVQEWHECFASSLIAKTTETPEKFWSVSTYLREAIRTDQEMYERGYVWRNRILPPTKEEDFFKWVAWFGGTTKEGAMELCNQYPLMKKKYEYLVEYYKETFDIDLEGIHWKE